MRATEIHDMQVSGIWMNFFNVLQEEVMKANFVLYNAVF